ncbi:MAG: inositol monophosphatase [Acidimicrobiales bacterium]|nr:inositol monophosphatase [Acidimicrobiales bacterium]
MLALALDLTTDLGPTLIQGRRAATRNVDTKSSKTDMVTEMDRWCEGEVVSRLLDARPDDGILGEEGASVDGTSGVRWIIDPIDGTTNYFYDLPGYSISIAAEIDGVISAGLVIDPIRAETFTATKGGGATRNGRPLSVSKVDDLSIALVGTGFNYQPDVRRDQAETLVHLLPIVRDIRRFGGAALDLCAVACGRLDIYFERGLSAWDVAAGGLIATEAGALLTDFSGQPSWTDQAVCGPPALHAALLAHLGSGWRA